VAAGEICDLVEQHGIFRPSGPPGAAAPDRGVKKTGKEEPAAAESSAGGREESEKKEDVEGTRKVKEKKKDKKDKKRKAETGVEETPAVTGEEGREEEEDPERVRIAKATPLSRREKKDKDPQSAVDHYVSEHPEVFGLGSIPIRGSAARHFKESDERRRERQQSPLGHRPEGQRRRDREREKTEIRGRGPGPGKSRKEKATGREVEISGAASKNRRNGTESKTKGKGRAPEEGPATGEEQRRSGSSQRGDSWVEAARHFEVTRAKEGEAGQSHGLGAGSCEKMEGGVLGNAEVTRSPGAGEVRRPGGDGSHLLPLKSHPGRQSQERDDEWWRRALEDEIERDRRRGPPAASYGPSRMGSESPHLWDRLQSGGGSRRFGPCSGGTPDEGGRRRRGVGDEPRAPLRGRSQRRRDGSPEGACGARPWSRGTGGSRSPSREGAGGERKEEEKRKEVQEETEERKRGGGLRRLRRCSPVRWQPAASGQSEKGPVAFCRDGLGSQGSHPQPGREKGEEVSEEEDREVLDVGQREQESEQLLGGCRRDGRVHLRAELQGQVSGGAFSRGAVKPDLAVDALDPPPGDWSGGQGQHFASSSHFLLPPASATQGERAYSERADDALSCGGPAGASASSQCDGYDATARQVHRAKPEWQPLVGESTAGDTPLRLYDAHPGPGGHQRTEGGLPGGESKVVVHVPGRESSPWRQGEWKEQRRRKRQECEQWRQGSERHQRRRRESRSRQEEGRLTLKTAERGEAAGAVAPEISGGSAQPEEDWHYKGGVEAASLPGCDPGVGRKHGYSDHEYDFFPDFLHGASAKTRDGRIHELEDGRPGPSGPAFAVAASEKTSCDAAGALGKKDAQPNPELKTLSGMGVVLLQNLMEVFPLRSQPMGGVY